MESLIKNARDLMVASAITATLMVGAYGLLVELAGFQTTNMYELLMIGVLVMLFTVALCVYVINAKFQRTVLSDANMTKCCGTNFNIIKGWTEVKEGDRYKKITNEYVRCSKEIGDEIADKVKWFKVAMYAFLAGLSVLPFVLILQYIEFMHSHVLA